MLILTNREELTCRSKGCLFIRTTTIDSKDVGMVTEYPDKGMAVVGVDVSNVVPQDHRQRTMRTKIIIWKRSTKK
jgi:hypothetical protein